jgi:hypothetical protein
MQSMPKQRKSSSKRSKKSSTESRSDG